MEKVFQRETLEAEGAPVNGNDSNLPSAADCRGQEMGEELAVTY